MSLVFRMGRRTAARRAAFLAEVVRRCELAVWRQVAPRLDGMDPQQQQGYIRARCGQSVRQAVAAVQLHAGPLDAKSARELIDAATDAVVARVIELRTAARRQVVRRAA